MSTMIRRRRLAGFLVVLFCFSIAQAAFGQTEKLGRVTYTPIKGWTKTAKGNVVVFSEIDTASGKFCTITLYGLTPGTGKAQSDFAREWNDRVVKPFGAEPNPKTETEPVDGWTATAGGSPIDFQGTKALAFLTVLSGSGSTVSILGIFNDESYLPKLVAFSSSIDVEKAAAAPFVAQPVAAPAQAPASAMHIAALVKEFENNEVRANQVWVGKRVRVSGTVNSIEIEKGGIIVLTFKSSVSTYKNGRCFFNKSQSARVATLSAHQEATVEGTVRGFGGGFDNSKAFLLLEDCTVP